MFRRPDFPGFAKGQRTGHLKALAFWPFVRFGQEKDIERPGHLTAHGSSAWARCCAVVRILACAGRLLLHAKGQRRDIERPTPPLAFRKPAGAAA
jgi:hypothetical protein